MLILKIAATAALLPRRSLAWMLPAAVLLAAPATAEDTDQPADQPAAANAQEKPDSPPTNQELLDRIEFLEWRLDQKDSTTAPAAVTQPPGINQGTNGSGTAGIPPDPLQFGRLGQMGRLGQTTRFSNAFNPAFGVAVDLLGNTSTRRDSVGAGSDRLYLRSAELNASAQFDPFGFAYMTLEATAGDETEVEFIEGAGVLNRLPFNMSVKAGKLLGDFARFGQRHEHDLPFAEKPGVYYDYFGGSLNPVGAELHQWLGLTDEVPVRWSVGVYNDFETHGHPIAGEEVEALATESKRRLNNLVYNARVTGVVDLSDEATLQLGASANWAPELQGEVEQANPGNPPMRYQARSVLGGVDLTYRWVDPATQRQVTLGTEVLSSHLETPLGGDGLTPLTFEQQRSYGGYAWGDYAWSQNWSAGVLLGYYHLRENDDIERAEYNLFTTWSISHFNRFRFQYRFNDLERGDPGFVSEPDNHEFILQWTFVIGSHAHGLNW